MKWTYLIEQKFKIAMALAIVFGLVLITNRINKNHFSELQASFASVYEDRLLVENYIFKLSGILNQRRLCLYDIEGKVRHKQYINTSFDSIESLLADYKKTKFTKNETALFIEFEQGMNKLHQLELNYYSTDTLKNEHRNTLESKHQILAGLLSSLSDIQMNEGQNIISESNALIATNNSFSRIEIVILIVIGIIVQMLVIASKPIKDKFPQKPHLN